MEPIPAVANYGKTHFLILCNDNIPKQTLRPWKVNKRCQTPIRLEKKTFETQQFTFLYQFQREQATLHEGLQKILTQPDLSTRKLRT